MMLQVVYYYYYYYYVNNGHSLLFFTDNRRLVYLKWHLNFLTFERGMLHGWEGTRIQGFVRKA